MKTRAYPVGDAQCNKMINKYAKMQTEFNDCITKYRDDDWEEQRVGDLMKTRRIDVMCLHDTRWGGNKAREHGDGCKLFYSGGKKARTGVGICV